MNPFASGMREALALEDFGEWLKIASPTMNWERHYLRHIREALAQVTAGSLKRLMIFAPPQHGKSEQTTVRYPVYRMERDPDFRVCIGCYNQSFSERFGRKSRRIAEARGLVNPDKSAASEWETRGGGVYRSCGVGSPPTGEGFNFIGVDDPTRSRADIESKLKRDRLLEWYGDLYSRRRPGCAIVIISTRWHTDDLCGRLLEQEASGGDKWAVIRLPSLAENQTQRDKWAAEHRRPLSLPEPLGRAEGEALAPDWYSAEDLAQTRRVKGAYSFDAEYQQDPKPRTGGFFEVDKLNYVDAGEVPELVSVCRGWDTAATEGAGDYTAGVKIGRCANGRFWVLHMEYGQWGTARRNARIRATAEKDGPTVRIRFPQNPADAGVDQAQAFIALVAGYSATAETCSGSKEVRSDPWSAQLNGGNVMIVRGPWNQFWEDCHQAFPGGIDDPVDATTDAFKGVLEPEGPSFVPWFGSVERPAMVVDSPSSQFGRQSRIWR